MEHLCVGSYVRIMTSCAIPAERKFDPFCEKIMLSLCPAGAKVFSYTSADGYEVTYSYTNFNKIHSASQNLPTEVMQMALKKDARAKRLFRLDEMEDQPVNIGDALTFADVLSKSCGTNLSDIHKTRAQEMVALLYDMYPQDTQVKYYLGSVLANTGNFLGMNRLTPDFENASLLERVFMHFNMDYLSVPADGEARFFPAQKEIYDSLSRPYFSYSAPTSMGKSFMMRAFIKQQIMDGAKKNFALLIPTKALINEVTSELIESLTTLLKETDYRIVTSSGSMALETKHNYIFVLTPERMLYILIDDPNLMIDYLFVDEAHKISSGDKRSAFYYKVINKLEERHSNTHIIFASPNIPNPRVYLDTLSRGEWTIGEESIVACRYAPVSQLKYIVDLWERNIRIFDSYSKKFILLHEMSRQYSLSEVIARIGDKRHKDLGTGVGFGFVVGLIIYGAIAT